METRKKIIYGIGAVVIGGALIAQRYYPKHRHGEPMRIVLDHDADATLSIQLYKLAIDGGIKGERMGDVDFGDGRTIVIRTKSCSRYLSEVNGGAAAPPNNVEVQCKEDGELVWSVRRE